MTDLYTQMILALDVGFFEDWQWKEGDKGITSKNEVLVLGIQNEYIWYYERGELIFSLNYIKNDIGMTHKSGIRPLPSQKQLQEILSKKYGCTPYELSKKFISYVIEGFVVENVEEKSLEVMWLELVMYVVYKNVWKMDTWV